jgi:LytS/YehU family sensor histidine kinase
VHRLGRPGSLAIAFFAATIVSVALTELIMYAVITPLGWDAGYRMESKGVTTPMRIVWEFVGAARWMLVLVALYELLESNQRAGAELHAARMTAIAAQQNLVEGELRAMQARVDPELLFNSLVSIDEGYAQGVDAGRQRLDCLIRFLRAALPSDFGGTSTVAREQELVEACVALLNQGRADPVRLQVSVDAGAGGEQMPSMLLLPLVRWALAPPSARNLRARIGRRGEMLAIEVESDARRDDATPADEVASVRDRIAQLYAEGAQLVIESARARLEIPRHARAEPLAQTT